MKKTIICVVCVIIGVILLRLPYQINDRACLEYRKEIEASFIDMPEVAVLQVVSGCGNSSGTGDHTDLYVAVLVETGLDKENLEKEISDIAEIHDVRETGDKTFAMDMIDLSFEEENYTDNANYYIIEFLKESPFAGTPLSALDLRGC